MTASEVALDSWAWWEVLTDTAKGRRLSKKYLEREEARVHTSAITIAEITAKLAALDRRADIAPIVQAISGKGRVHEVSTDIAELAGPLRDDLRRTNRSASLADAIVLITARKLGVDLVSADPAFSGHPDVTPD